MKLVITDWDTVTNGDIDRQILNCFGDVACYGKSTPAQAAARVADAQAILCNKTPMNEQTLSRAAQLLYIGLFATGYNNVDLDYTKRRGITVCNVPDYSTQAVAQHVFALILHHYSRVADYAAFVSRGGWVESDTFSPFVYPTAELFGKTIGIVGYGNIGQAVAKLADTFGMRVIVYTRTKRAAVPFVRFVDFDTLLAQADIISVHCPLNRQTAGLFGKAAFETCKTGAFFVNTARGGLVDNAALLSALRSGKLAGAALDVLDEEPMRSDCILHGAPNLTLTPHIAWAPLETRRRLVETALEQLTAFIGGKPIHTL